MLTKTRAFIMTGIAGLMTLAAMAQTAPTVDWGDSIQSTDIIAIGKDMLPIAAPILIIMAGITLGFWIFKKVKKGGG
jgi:hypothetical protein